MSERTRGVYGLLRNPVVYDALQRFIRPPSSYRGFVERHVRPATGTRVLDIGCGTATILSYLPSVEYLGVDVSAAYIRRATQRFGDRGTFMVIDCADCLNIIPDSSVDLVLALGVLHHVDDAVASNLLKECARALAPGGRFVSHDPVSDKSGTFGARFFVHLERGKHVRTRAELLALVAQRFAAVELFTVSDSLRIPFQEIILECRAQESVDVNRS